MMEKFFGFFSGGNFSFCPLVRGRRIPGLFSMGLSFPAFGFLLALFLFLGFSCDLLRNSPYVVETWSPGEGFHDDPANIKISLLFSNESDKIRTEQAFSLTEDREPVKGDFSWEENRLFFEPASPLETNRDYFISLGTGARDLNGISLENKFEVSFTTRSPEEKPKITGTNPENDGCISASRGEFSFFFSERVHINSCVDFISFNPVTQGSWRLEEEGKTARFTPRDPWQRGELYRVTVRSDFSGVSGAAIGTEYSSAFYIDEDREAPVLLEVKAVLPGENILAEEIAFAKKGAAPSPEYSGWERSGLLELIFSEPVDSVTLRNLLSVEPAAVLVMDSPPETQSVFRFRFAEDPEWGSLFLFRLSPGVKDKSGNESAEEYTFRITCSGSLSKPPSLAGIRLPLAPGKNPGKRSSGEFQDAASFTSRDLFSDLAIESGEGRYPYMEETGTWIELYFETAEDTGMDLLSVMELFRVESTNRALTFSPESIAADNFTWEYPKEGWENLRRVEVSGVLTNMVQSGVVTFCIPPGLKDMRGNRSNDNFRISLLK